MHKKVIIGVAGFVIGLFFMSSVNRGFCDILRLKELGEGEEGHEVEILEERKDSFIIKVPKDAVKKIKRKQPSDLKLWKTQRIIWEDSGDYIAIYLPKEKIVLPEGYTGEEYDSAKVFIEEGLSVAGAEGRPSGMSFFGATGRVTGRVVRHDEGIFGVNLKIVNVSRQENLVSKLFGPKVSKPEDSVFETESDEFGRFEFKVVPIGEYDLYWKLPGSDNWYRRLSENPDIMIRPGETTEYHDIRIK